MDGEGECRRVLAKLLLSSGTKVGKKECHMTKKKNTTSYPQLQRRRRIDVDFSNTRGKPCLSAECSHQAQAPCGSGNSLLHAEQVS